MSLLRHYCVIITSLLRHYYIIITSPSLQFHYYILLHHYYIIITPLLLIITISLLHIITSSFIPNFCKSCQSFQLFVFKLCILIIPNHSNYSKLFKSTPVVTSKEWDLLQTLHVHTLLYTQVRIGAEDL